ncbi:hypothetical protein D3C71_1592060 [compost metagenome]
MVVVAAGHAERNIVFDAVNQFDDLLLACAGFFEFVANDVVAEQFGGCFRRKAVEVCDDLVQAPIEVRLLAFAVGIPKSVVQRVGGYAVTHHQGHGLLQQGGCLARVFRVALNNAGGFV